MNELEKMKAGLWYDANHNLELIKKDISVLIHILN